MSSTNFMAVASKEIQSFNNTYTNARYAPTGNEKVGKPFPSYKEYAGRNTDWRPSGLRISTWKKEFNLPTNNNFFRTSVTADAISLGNAENAAWVQKTQTLSNVSNTLGCNSDADCDAWPGTTCNLNYEDWNQAYGNQSGGYCSKTYYPELGPNVGPMGGGTYHRKLTNQGGIGKSCYNDSECAEGYSCNSEYDPWGSAIQQTGYCAKKFECPDGKTHFLGTPWNAGIPVVPPVEQNNNGQGYPTKDICLSNALSQQDCVKAQNGKYYAVYPAYCGVEPSLRKDNKPYSSVQTSSPQEINQGFKIPAYATNKSSTTGGKTQAFSTVSWNMPQNVKEEGMTEAWRVSRAMNPIPKNLY